MHAISLAWPDLFSAQGVIAPAPKVRALILQAITPCAEKRSGHARLLSSAGRPMDLSAMTSRNKTGGDSVGTMHVGRMEEQVFYDVNEIESGETLVRHYYARHYEKQPLDPLIVRKIYLTRNAMVLMSHECFPLILFRLSS